MAALVATAVILGFALRPAPQAQGAPIAPAFTLPVLWGGKGNLSLSELRGRPVLLNFFQSDCPPCLDEMAVLARAARGYRATTLAVVAISSLGDSEPAAQRLARADRLPFPVLFDSHQDLAWHYGVTATPTSMFIDGQGRVRGLFVGQLSSQIVRDGLAQAGVLSCTQCMAVSPPVLGGAAPVQSASAVLRATDVFQPPYRAAAAFALPDQRGQMVTPASLRGRVVALTFLSAVCTEECPLVGQALSRARSLLGHDAAGLSIVAVSVAPEQDSAAATQRFARKSGWIGTDWHYLTAPRALLAQVWKKYWVYVQTPPPIFKTTGTNLVHQAGVYLIDPQGHLRAYDDVPFLASDLAASVHALLAPSSG
jgi:cytochrome oxidase Cu insertion factor (SCO1/SenC/PrrC family)